MVFKRLKEKLEKIKEENNGKGLWEVATEDYLNWKIKKISDLLEWKEKKLMERRKKRLAKRKNRR